MHHDRKKLLIQGAILPLLLCLHVIIGTVVFIQLEAKHEISALKNSTAERVHFLEHMKNLNISEVAQLMTLVKSGCSKDHDVSATNPWSFWNAFGFCFNLITTIGYGVFAPHDTIGRGFCMVYAVIGIPIMTIHLGIINRFLLQGIDKLDLYVKSLHVCNLSAQKSRPIIRIGVISLAFAAFLIIHFIIFFALQYIRDSDNVTPFFDSIYFTVTTYGTIGFGDITPQSMNHTPAMELFRVMLFASTGLALVALCFSLFREEAVRKMTVISQKLTTDIGWLIPAILAQAAEQGEASGSEYRALDQGTSYWGRLQTIRSRTQLMKLKSQDENETL